MDAAGDPTADWIHGASGKIVLIGGGFEDSRDSYPTPGGPRFGVELNALAIDSYLNNPGIRDLPEPVLFASDLCVGVAIVFIFWLFEHRLHNVFLLRPYVPLLLSTIGICFIIVGISYALLRMGSMALWFNFIPVLVGVNIHQFYEHLESAKKEAALEQAPKRHPQTRKHSE